MQPRQYLLIANRAYAWERMVRLGLNVAGIAAVAGSYLERRLVAEGVPHFSFDRKRQLLDWLKLQSADVVVSNGCPFILPISALTEPLPGVRFVNLHPSCLPDLKGPHPINGALLHGRDAGASCHLMDDGIDTGSIISRVRIPFSPDLDAGLLYQLCFQAEADAFELALTRDFAPLPASETLPGPRELPLLYYRAGEEDLRIDFGESAQQICRRIRAFATRGRGAFAIIAGERFVIRDVETIENPYVLEQLPKHADRSILFVYEGRVVVRLGSECLKLKAIEGPVEKLSPAQRLV
ncbi:MAG: formyltransferase family protein [Verrucomicrobiota bacterium JB022]|nr:formyltransferase family protein [Verrucomicrobiota bacterium JB022]